GFQHLPHLPSRVYPRRRQPRRNPPNTGLDRWKARPPRLPPKEIIRAVARDAARFDDSQTRQQTPVEVIRIRRFQKIGVVRIESAMMTQKKIAQQRRSRIGPTLRRQRAATYG